MKILTQDNQSINYDEANDVIFIMDVFHLGINNPPDYKVNIKSKYDENNSYHQLGTYSTKERAVEVLKQIIEQNDIEQKTFIMPKNKENKNV